MNFKKYTITTISLIFSISLMAIAQIEPVGYFIDNAGQEINGFLDMDYYPNNPYECNSSVSGYYLGGFTDLKGEYHSGKLKLENNKKVFYRLNDKELAKELNIDSLSSFVIAKDTFAIGHGFTAENVFHNSGIMLKESSIGSFGFFRYLTKNSPYYMQPHWGYEVQTDLNYFVNKGNLWMHVPKKDRRFVKFMSSLVTHYGFDSLYNDVLEGKYTYKNYNKVLFILDTYIHFAEGRKNYYSSGWETVDEKAGFSYFSEVVNLEGYKADINYYDFEGRKIIEVSGQILNSDNKDGKFRWYYSNGNIRKEASFREGKEVGTTIIFYPNGSKHWTYYINSVGEKMYQGVYSDLGELLFTTDGIEKFYDNHNKREITRRYEKSRLVESFYLDKGSGQKIYQLVPEKNAEMKSEVSTSLNSRLQYTKDAQDSLVEGLVLLRIIVSPNGGIHSVDLVKGINPSIDEMVIKRTLSLQNTYKKPFRSASIAKEKVFQELIFPVTFRLKTYKSFSSYIGDPFLWQLQWQNEILFEQQKMQWKNENDMERIQKLLPPNFDH